MKNEKLRILVRTISLSSIPPTGVNGRDMFGVMLGIMLVVGGRLFRSTIYCCIIARRRRRAAAETRDRVR